MKAHGVGHRAGPIAAARVVKTTGEKRYTLALVYPVNRADISVAADGWRDFAGPDAVEQAAWSFMKSGQRVGLWHLPGDATEGAGTVVESYIHRSGPWVIKAADGSQQTISDGDWLAGIIWDEPSWQLIKQGKLTGLSMQGTATRRMPTPEALAGLRKMREQEDMVKSLKKAVRKVVDARAVELRQEADALREQIARVARSGPVCERGHANRPGARYCVSCGEPVGMVAKAASVVAAGLPRQADLVAKARDRSDPEGQVRALGAMFEREGPDAVVRALGGSYSYWDGAVAVLAKTEAAARDAEHQRPCKTCRGTGRLRHPYSGNPSKKCPACDGTGTLAAGEVPDAPDVQKLARLAVKALGGDQEAMGQLIGQVGPVIAARVLSGESVSAADFTRGFVSAGRARLSAAPGQEPRVPQPSHIVRPSDFTRGPLTTGQQRPAPGSQWPGSGGQSDSYRGGPGIRPDVGSAPFPLPGLAASSRPVP
jgi:Putative phage serine protease XkdF